MNLTSYQSIDKTPRAGALYPIRHSSAAPRGFKPNEHYLSFVAKKLLFIVSCFSCFINMQHADSLVFLALSICRLRKLASVFEIVSNTAVFSTRFSLGF